MSDASKNAKGKTPRRGRPRGRPSRGPPSARNELGDTILPACPGLHEATGLGGSTLSLQNRAVKPKGPAPVFASVLKQPRGDAS